MEQSSQQKPRLNHVFRLERLNLFKKKRGAPVNKFSRALNSHDRYIIGFINPQAEIQPTTAAVYIINVTRNKHVGEAGVFISFGKALEILERVQPDKHGWLHQFLKTKETSY